MRAALPFSAVPRWFTCGGFQPSCREAFCGTGRGSASAGSAINACLQGLNRQIFSGCAVFTAGQSSLLPVSGRQHTCPPFALIPTSARVVPSLSLSLSQGALTGAAAEQLGRASGPAARRVRGRHHGGGGGLQGGEGDVKSACPLQVNSRTRGPQKLKCLISLCPIRCRF